MLANQTAGLGTKFEYGKRGSIIHVQRRIQQVAQLIVQLLPFVIGKLSAFDFLTRYLAHVGDKTVHQLYVAHFKGEQGNGIAEVHGNVLRHRKHECRLTHGRTGSYDNEVGVLPAGSHLVQFRKSALKTAQTVGTGGGFLNKVVRFGNDRIDLRIVLLHVLLRNLEEHLVEGALYAANKSGKVNVHFTVSPEHRALFKALVDEKAAAYARKYGVDYNISFSEQKPSTDTVAADMENKPFRDNGKLLFRPGGHGALIENLNDLDADVIFIKNIDNVVPDKLKGDTVLYKKLIAGVLITLQQQAFAYLQLLDSGKYTHEQVLDILQFVQKKLFCKNPETKNLEDAELVIYLKEKLNRPMRVCGMVKNVGEPGGGPFLAYNSDGTISLQILESSQIDMNDPEKKDMFEKGTHFNPVDLVCAVRDYKGHKFDLVKYVDKATGFISYKSKNGKDLKALELPGLWNGAMSDWNTVFVEVPLTTFNPVKTVNDLLREQHQ